MITTGKPEFARFLWPLIANADSQVYLAAFRAAERFRPMVLGEDVRGKLSELPDEIREHVIAQFAWESGIDGMELAAEVAKTDPLPQVQFAVIEALQFRSCDGLVKEMLKTAPPAVWSLLAQKGYAREIRDPEAAARLREEERSIIEKDPNPLRRLEHLARSEAEGDKIAAAIEALISSTDFPMKEQNARWRLTEMSKRIRTMLRDSEVILFCQTTNGERARAFYGDTLGLKFQGEDPFALAFSTGGVLLRVQKMRTEYSPLDWTRFGWQVSDIVASVKELARRGVTFERRPGVVQDELGIWTVPGDGTKVAWFKDPDGNLLSLTQFPARP